MGGMHGFGAIEPEADEPVFHHAWEGRVHALSVAMRRIGKWNTDMSRFAMEQIAPRQYLSSSYYERWLLGMLRLLVERRVVTEEELATGRASGTGNAASEAAAPAIPAAAPQLTPKFRIGNRVLARTMNPTGHTRLPRYVRGRRGVVIRDHGVFVLPDVHGTTGEQHWQHVYSVRFAARELWGEDAPPGDSISIDLWDDYLEAL